MCSLSKQSKLLNLHQGFGQGGVQGLAKFSEALKKLVVVDCWHSEALACL